MSEIEIDPERQTQAKRYARLQRRLMLVDLLLSGLYLLAWLFFGWSQRLRDALLNFTENEWLLVVGFASVFGGLYLLLSLPLSYYSGFILPHRFDLSTQTISGWVLDQLKSFALAALLGGLLLEVIYALLRASPDWWWLWVALVMLLFNVLLTNLAPVLLLPIFYKLSPLGEEYAGLSERLLSLADRAHTHVCGVYQFDMSRRTKAANAALVGLGNTRRIILGDTLLKEFTPDEIETVLAHELAHHVHRDIPIGIIVEGVLTLAGLYLAALGLDFGVHYFSLSGVDDVAGMPLLGLAMGAYGLLTLPLGNAFSRWRERRADQYALQITDNGVAYASALTRLANQNLADADPESWVEFILYSHPALKRRIALAQQYTASRQTAVG